MASRVVVDELLCSDEPSIRWKVQVNVLGEDPDSRPLRRLREEIRTSARARALIDGRARYEPSTYSKWLGTHWVLASLADLGYPPGDEGLIPLRDELLSAWLHPYYLRDVEVTTRAAASARSSQGIPLLRGLSRAHGSQHGSALLSIVRLGLDDGRTAQVAERLLHWQWPDGGWNCDRDPRATTSSTHETLLPMRGLFAYSTAKRDRTAADAAHRAAEVLLTRRMLFHRTSGELIHRDWPRLRYPSYWHYDVLAGLKGIAEIGLIDDERCADALDLLQSKQIPGGGWPAEAAYHRGFGKPSASYDHVSWGRPNAAKTNEWVSADVLAILAAAGRL